MSKKRHKNPIVENVNIPNEAILSVMTSQIEALSTVLKTTLVYSTIVEQNPEVLEQIANLAKKDEQAFVSQFQEQAVQILDDFATKIEPFNQAICEVAEANQYSSLELGLFFLQKVQAFLEDFKQKFDKPEKRNS